MSEFLNIVAAEMGTVLRKKDRSSTRIARFTGGRNISEKLLEVVLDLSVAGSMEETKQLELVISIYFASVVGFMIPVLVRASLSHVMVDKIVG